MTGPDEAQPGVLRVFQSRQETRAFYDKISKVYDVLAERSEEPMRRRGLEMLAVREGESALEIGFGTGSSLLALRRAVGPSGSVHGIELSPGMIEQAQRRLEGEGVLLSCGDATQLPYAPGSFDAIFISFTLELFDTPEIPALLAECRRVLVDGGRLSVVGMSKAGKDGLAVHVFEWTHRHFPNFLDCRPIYVRRALEAAGFRIADARREHMWVPVEVVLGISGTGGSGTWDVDAAPDSR